jgi:hypothetical protein
LGERQEPGFVQPIPTENRRSGSDGWRRFGQHKAQVGTKIGGPGLRRGLQLAGRSGPSQSQGLGRILFSIFWLGFSVLFNLLFSCKIQEISKWPKVKNALRVIKKFLLWVNLEIEIKFSVAIFCNFKKC